MQKTSRADTHRPHSQRIVKKVQPERLIRFGSHARGDARLDSDVDLPVVMDFEGPPATSNWRYERRFATCSSLRTSSSRNRTICLAKGRCGDDRMAGGA